MRALTAFVDPARWEHGERIYTPQMRNRLEVIQMLVSGPHAEERIAKGWGHLRIYNDGYEAKNLLTAKPVTIVERDTLYTAVTNALGMRPQDAWQSHAHLLGKSCETCIFAKAQRPATPGLTPYCPRWNKNQFDLATCEGWISAAYGPVVIPVREYYVREQFNDAKAVSPAYLFSEPFAYTNDLKAYLAAYEAATNDLIERAAEKEDRRTNAHRQAIAEFYAWQKALPAEAIRHSQAHACVACRYFEPLNGDAPCRFALNPLQQWGEPKAPQMGVLYGPTLTALPRCEMFTRVHLPLVFQQPGFSIDKKSRRSLLNWMKAVRGRARFSYYAEQRFLWRGPFAWLVPVGDGRSCTWDDVAAYLGKHWDEVGDGGMATLLDALLLEVQAGDTYKGAIELLDLADGKAEAWMPVRFAERNQEQSPWPESWLRPWMTKTLAQVFDETGMLEEDVSLQL